MNKLFSILVIVVTLFSCSSYEERNFSAIEQLVGKWELQSRTINSNLPLPTEAESLFFSEDNKINDYKGNYELISEDTSSGVFSLDTQYANLIFTSNSENTIHRFFLNNISMVLTRTEDNGDVISDTWVKVLN